ncbi:hypothetical protein GCM10023097_53960 [Streptomyces collinus]
MWGAGPERREERGRKYAGGGGLMLAFRHPPLPKAIPSSDRCPIRLTGAEAPTRVRRKRSGTWPTGIAMSVAGATVGE